jgi:hypothetical protein
MTDPQLIEIPTFELIIPEPNIDWAWQTYSSLVLDIIEASLEGIPGELNGIWAQWEAIHNRLWSSGFDLVTTMGYVNVLLGEKNKEISYGRTLYAAAKGSFAEALRTRNLRLYLKTRLDIEKRRQTRHTEEQSLLMDFAKGMIEASVQEYNTAVMEFKARIRALKLEGERWQAVIAANEVELKELELQLKEAQLLSEQERGEIRRQRALVGIRLVEAEIARLDVELQLNETRLIAIGMETSRAEMQALLVGTQIIEEQAQVLSLHADIDILNAQNGETDILNAEMVRMQNEIANITIVNSGRDAMYSEVLSNKAALLVEIEAAQSELSQAQLAYVAAQSEANTARNNLSMANMTASDEKEDAASDYQIAKENYSDGLEILRVQQSHMNTTISLKRQNLALEYEADKKEAQARASEILKRSRVLNRFTEYSS